MKIRIVSRPIAPPWDSGSMNMAYGVGTCLSEYRHMVYMPVVRGFHPAAAAVVAEPVYTSRIFGFSQKARLISHLLTAQPVDIMHFFLTPTHATAAILSLAAKMRRTPAVLTVTHIPGPGKQPCVFGQRVVTYSAYLARLLQQSGVKEVTHIPPGVNEQAIRPGMDGGRAGHTLGIAPGAPVVLCGGEFSRSSTLETWLEAIPICLSSHPGVIFVLAYRTRNKREQAHKQALDRRLREVAWGRNVIVQEWVADMLSLIARADVCVLPLRDTYGKIDIPLFLLEAMALAKPIVITDIAPLNELLEESVGLAVPVGDEIALAQAIMHMLVEGEHYGGRGRRLVERKYTLRRVAQQYERLYAEMLSAGHSGLLQ